MKKTCPDTLCPQHRIRLQGNFCPACGAKAIRLPLYPFAVYVKPKVFLIGCGILSFAAIFLPMSFLFIVPGIQSCSQKMQMESQHKQELINGLPANWRALYSAMKSVGVSNAYDVLKKVAENDGLKNYPPISGEAVGMFVELGHNWDKEKIAGLLLSKVSGEK